MQHSRICFTFRFQSPIRDSPTSCLEHHCPSSKIQCFNRLSAIPRLRAGGAGAAIGCGGCFNRLSAIPRLRARCPSIVLITIAVSIAYPRFPDFVPAAFNLPFAVHSFQSPIRDSPTSCQRQSVLHKRAGEVSIAYPRFPDFVRATARYVDVDGRFQSPIRDSPTSCPCRHLVRAGV